MPQDERIFTHNNACQPDTCGNGRTCVFGGAYCVPPGTASWESVGHVKRRVPLEAQQAFGQTRSFEPIPLGETLGAAHRRKTKNGKKMLPRATIRGGGGNFVLRKGNAGLGATGGDMTIVNEEGPH